MPARRGSESPAGHRVDIATADLRAWLCLALLKPGVQVVRVEGVAFVEAVRLAQGLHHVVALVDVQGKHHQVVQHSAAQQHAGDRRVVADRAMAQKA